MLLLLFPPGHRPAPGQVRVRTAGEERHAASDRALQESGEISVCGETALQGGQTGGEVRQQCVLNHV